MSQFWNEENLKLAVETLENSASVASACEKLSKALGKDVSRDTLGRVFKRHGLDFPSQYVGTGAVDLWKVAVDESASRAETSKFFWDRMSEKHESFSSVFPEDFKEGYHNSDSEALDKTLEDWKKGTRTGLPWRIDFDQERYCFFYFDMWVYLTFDQMETACFLYSSYPPGRNFTRREVSGFLAALEGLEWITEDFVCLMFTSIGFVKRMLPRSPHQGFSNAEEMIPSWHRKMDSLLKADSNKDTLKYQQTVINDLQNELREVFEVHELFEKSKKLKFARFDIAQDDSVNEHTIHIHGFGDFHAGKIVKPGELTALKNVYNAEEMRKRIAKVIQVIEQTAKDSGATLVIASWLGDLFEALLGNMRQMMHLSMKEFAQEQYDLGISAFVAITDALLRCYNCKIVIYITAGNHDRILESREARTELLLNHLMCEHLRALYKDEARIEIHEAGQVSSVMLPNGVNYMFQHGHLGPLRPTSNEKDFVNFVDLHKHVGAERYLIQIGHWHSLSYRSFSKNGKVFFIPTIIGADEYATDHLHKSNPAEYAFVCSTDSEDRLMGPYNVLV